MKEQIEKLRRGPPPSKERLEAEQRDLESLVVENEQERLIAYGLKPKRIINYENLPSSSLQYIADKFGKSTRQVRRWCEEGLPGAYLTQGNHWRIKLSPELLENQRAWLKGKTRNRGVIDGKKLGRKLGKQELPPPPEDLIGGELAYVMGPDKYNLVFAIRTLQIAEQRIDVTHIAEAMDLNRSTLYRKFGRVKLREMIRSAINVAGVEPEEHFQELGKTNTRNRK